MYTEDFIKKTNDIIKAYKGYNIMKMVQKAISSLWLITVNIKLEYYKYIFVM